MIQAPAKIIHGMWDLENNHCFHFITETGHYKCIYMERMYDVNNMLAINVNGSMSFYKCIVCINESLDLKVT